MTDKEVGILIGELKGIYARFDALDAKIDSIKTTLCDRITRHEAREEPRIRKIERLVWIGVGGVIVVGAVASAIFARL